MLSFSLVAEALTGLIYHRPSGENSNFQFSMNSSKTMTIAMTKSRSGGVFEVLGRCSVRVMIAPTQTKQQEKPGDPGFKDDCPFQLPRSTFL